MTDRPLLGERADLRRIVESVLNIPSAGHASAEELATTILDALSDVLTPAAAVLNWENGEARSPLGDLYSVEGLSTNVWVTYWNGTALNGWRISIEKAKAEAQADYIRRSAFAALEAQVEGMRVAEWRPIETAPDDGTIIHVWADGYEWPEAVRYERYSPEDAEEVGEPGYWRYAEELLANAVDSCDFSLWTHWQPLPAPPARAALQSSETTGEQP